MDATDDLRKRIEDIVRRGKAVRQQVAAVIASTSRQALATAEGLAGVVRTTIHGASDALAAAVPADRDDTLRQVVDGLGDGLQTAAHASELTLREAGRNVANFAREDLDRLARGFESMSKDFVSSVIAGSKQVVGQGRTQFGELEQHASATLRRIAPSLRAAVDAARRDPGGLVKGALDAGVAAARGAAGALFTAIGTKLKAAGESLSPPRDSKP